MFDMSFNEQDPGRKNAVTNADEQEVAVNHSTTDHGYDEPATESDSTVEASKEVADSSKEVSDGKNSEGIDRIKGKPNQTKSKN
jgi:hypothetical protein